MDSKDLYIESLKAEIKGLKWSFDEMTKERDFWKDKYKNRGKAKGANNEQRLS